MLAAAVRSLGRRRAAAAASRSFAAPPPPPPPRSSPPAERWRAAAANQSLYLAALVVGMVGATYGAVPLYRLFCQATGFGGTVKEGATVEAKLRARKQTPSSPAAPPARPITVTFNADVADGLHWRFAPAQRAVAVRPGQSALAFFTATNLTARPITGVSTYNVAPQHAAPYFNKVQCFCFEEQRLLPGESVDMPVLFYIDPEFADDRRLRGVDTLTLSYTFFLVDDGTMGEAEVAARRGAAEAAREAEDAAVAALAAARARERER
jgi:cytochrome c oxidase assembly protein subunit 11